jgi:hypothetical protein
MKMLLVTHLHSININTVYFISNNRKINVRIFLILLKIIHSFDVRVLSSVIVAATSPPPASCLLVSHGNSGSKLRSWQKVVPTEILTQYI